MMRPGEIFEAMLAKRPIYWADGCEVCALFVEDMEGSSSPISVRIWGNGGTEVDLSKTEFFRTPGEVTAIISKALRKVERELSKDFPN